MLAYSMPAAAAAWIIGGVIMCRQYPADWPRLLAVEGYAAAIAVGVVVLGLLAMKAWINHVCRKNPQTNVAFTVASTWTTLRLVNIAVVAAIGVSAKFWVGQPQELLFTAFFLWLGGSYIIILIGESIWLARSLRQLGKDDAGAK